jgi:hypothetical protein
VLGDADALRNLGWRARREVILAVQNGRAVDDPSLASNALDYARWIQHTARLWSWRTPAGWLSLLISYLRRVWAALPLLIVGVVVFHDRVQLILAAALLLALGYGLAGHARELPRRAAQSESVNLQLASPGSLPALRRSGPSDAAQVVMAAILGLGVLDAAVVAAFADWGSLVVPAVAVPAAIVVVLVVDLVVRGVRDSRAARTAGRR